eukprot:6514931-Prymnesium_polylepis.2
MASTGRGHINWAGRGGSDTGRKQVVWDTHTERSGATLHDAGGGIAGARCAGILVACAQGGVPRGRVSHMQVPSGCCG